MIYKKRNENKYSIKTTDYNKTNFYKAERLQIVRNDLKEIS